MIKQLLETDKNKLKVFLFMFAVILSGPALMRLYVKVRQPDAEELYGGEFIYYMLILLVIAASIPSSLYLSGLKGGGRLDFLLSLPFKRSTLWIVYGIRNLIVVFLICGSYLLIYYKYILEFTKSSNYPLDFTTVALNTVLVLPILIYSISSFLSCLYIYLDSFVIIPFILLAPVFYYLTFYLWRLYETNFNQYCMISILLSSLFTFASLELFKRSNG